VFSVLVGMAEAVPFPNRWMGSFWKLKTDRKPETQNSQLPAVAEAGDVGHVMASVPGVESEIFL
jgi:hypothetical protein